LRLLMGRPLRDLMGVGKIGDFKEKEREKHRGENRKQEALNK